MTQRVIKFRRAYFNYDGSFYGFKAWGPNIEGGDGFISPSYIHGCKSGPDQQFSGLTDRHGKEIYEKDLIRWHDDIFRVEYDGGGFKGENITQNIPGYLSWEHFSASERIGDAYTTPELVDPKMIER